MNRIAAMLVAAVAVGLSACGEVMPPTEPNGPSFARAGAAQSQVIVVFHENTVNPRGLAQQLAAAAGGELTYTYEHAIKGFAGSFPAVALEGIRRNPNVDYIELDGEMTISTTQSNATWGLDRIDQRDLPLNGTYVYNADGTGVNTYIIDTGIRFDHVDFGGRAVTGFDAVTSGGTAEDCHGHGTHVAGTVGGTTWGVAKKVKLYAVRVLNCNGSGTTSGVVAGIDWVTANHVKPAVANMSLGGGASSTLDNAVANSTSKGVTYAVSGGNSNADACNYSPAREPSAITVGATTSSDDRASYSNFGTCLDLFAPGSSITSAWYTSSTATNTISGTSMASPHVAGVAALYLQGNTGASPSTVANAITSNATTGKVASAGSGSPNLLLYSGFIGGGEGGTPTNNAPTASFTYSCSDLTCSFTDGSTDSDGTIASRAWTFGDGGTSTATNPSRTYAAEGTYTVSLTVTDDDGATGSTSQNVTVTAPSSGGITLQATGYKVKGTKMADLSWSGASGTNVDIRVDGSVVTTTPNDGAYTYNSNSKGGGSYTFKVCEAGTSTCSNSVTVNY
ncbi:MAG TPA: S8 family serine peptidase [Gemmatimonadales bacterium]|nr:S8 family serine peptidase [Gemmatimonadales bacterium]